jgi:hypothetical protein
MVLFVNILFLNNMKAVFFMAETPCAFSNMGLTNNWLVPLQRSQQSTQGYSVFAYCLKSDCLEEYLDPSGTEKHENEEN